MWPAPVKRLGSPVLDPSQPIEIYNIINSLNINNTSGFDNIASFFLQMGGEILASIFPYVSAMFLNWEYFHPFSKLKSSTNFLIWK